MLGKGDIEIGMLHGSAIEEKLHVAGDSNNLKLAILLDPHAEGVANRILPRPEFFGRALADDRHISAVFVVRVGKVAATDEIDAHHAEILGRNNVEVCVQFRWIGGNRRPIHVHPVAAIAKVAQGNRACVADILHARDLMQAGADVAGELACLLVGHADLVGVDGEIHDVIRLETEVRGLHCRKAAHEQAGDDQQHEGAGDLQGDQAIAEPMAPTRDAAAAFVQYGVYVRLGDAECGDQANDNAGEQCDGKRIKEDSPIEVERKQDWQIGVHIEVTERGVAPNAKSHARHAAHQREGDALCNHLANEPGSLGSKGGADGHFAFTDRGAHQNQVGDVDACQQQNHDGKGQK